MKTGTINVEREAARCQEIVERHSELLTFYYCLENGLDYENSSDYSKAAMAVGIQLEPLNVREAANISNSRDLVLTNSHSDGTEYCLSEKHKYNSPQSDQQNSLYGWFRDIQEKVRNAGNRIEKGFGNIIDDIRIEGDGGGIRAEARIPVDKLVDKTEHALVHYAARKAAENLRRTSEEYDRERKALSVKYGAYTKEYIRAKKVLSDRAVYQTMNVIRPLMAVIKKKDLKQALTNILSSADKEYYKLRNTLVDAARQLRGNNSELFPYFAWLLERVGEE